MNTARQATENMEYVRRLLEESRLDSPRPWNWPCLLSAVRSSGRRKTMELTLRPGRHEIIEKQDPVHEWRVARLARLGIPWPVAEAAAGQVDWHPSPAHPMAPGAAGPMPLVQDADEGNR
jgi:hypothetical protein